MLELTKNTTLGTVVVMIEDLNDADYNKLFESLDLFLDKTVDEYTEKMFNKYGQDAPFMIEQAFEDHAIVTKYYK